MSKPHEPFQFYTRLCLQELTGLRARNVKELASYLKMVPDSVIYHHTHHFLQQHQYLTPEPPNDFAYWVTTALNEITLGEKLASINTIEFSTLRDLRDKIALTLGTFLEKAKEPLREANEGQELHFLKSVSFIIPTPYAAASLEEFASILKKVTIDSLYFHMFEARIYHSGWIPGQSPGIRSSTCPTGRWPSEARSLDAKGSNDFSIWFETSLDEAELAKKVARLDPYTYTLEGLRSKLIELVKKRLEKIGASIRGESHAETDRV